MVRREPLGQAVPLAISHRIVSDARDRSSVCFAKLQRLPEDDRLGEGGLRAAVLCLPSVFPSDRRLEGNSPPNAGAAAEAFVSKALARVLGRAVSGVPHWF
jgi:hypothetical protein